MKYLILTLSFLFLSWSAQAQTPAVQASNLAENINDSLTIGLVLDDLHVPQNRTYAISLDNGTYSKSNAVGFQFGYRRDKKWSGNGGFSFSEKTHKFGGKLSLSREW